MKARKYLSLMIVAALTASLVLSGCGKKEQPTENSTAKSTEASKKEELKPVELRYILLNVAKSEDARNAVFDKCNEIVKKEINAKVNFEPMQYADFSKKLPIMMAANEQFDATFISPGIGDFYGSVSKGGLMDITQLLPKYAPKTYASLKPEWWDTAKVNGKIYGVINQQIFARQPVITVNKNYIDKFKDKFDPTKVKSLADMESLMKAVKESGETIYGSSYDLLPQAAWNDLVMPMNYEALNGTNVGAISINGNGPIKVINQYASKEFNDTFKTLYDWKAKKYGTIEGTPESQLRDLKKYYIWRIEGTYKPGIEGELAPSRGNVPMTAIKLGKPYLSTSGANATMTAVSANSKNPERTLMFIELLSTNKELYNTLSLGIEGADYKKVGDNKVEWIADRKYNNSVDWSYGNVYNTFIKTGQDDNVWKDTDKMNREATTSKLMGFSVDIKSIKTEIANTSAVIKEYTQQLQAKIGDNPEPIIKEFLSKLDKAGAQKVVDELQKQVDAFIAANKK